MGGAIGLGALPAEDHRGDRKCGKDDGERRYLRGAFRLALRPQKRKSFNSELGVPLAILGLENAWRSPVGWARNMLSGIVLLFGRDYPEWLVLEVGADRPGDIRRIARWLKPLIAVVTGVPEIPVHVEYFDSPEALAREKRVLAEYIQSGGKLVLNGDDSRMVALCADYRGMTVKYGFGAVMISRQQAKRLPIRITSHGYPLSRQRTRVFDTRLRLRCLGRPRAYGALAALAVAEIVGVDIVSGTQALAEWVPPPGRMRIIQGVRGSTIIDDTYNSSPTAALAALDALKDIKDGRKIAVLGDMLELGKYSAEAHRNVGSRAAACAYRFITVGFRARGGRSGARCGHAGRKHPRIRTRRITTRRRRARAEMKEGDIVLVKGSQSMRMERTVLALMAEPDRAPELLVRQDEEWKTR